MEYLYIGDGMDLKLRMFLGEVELESGSFRGLLDFPLTCPEKLVDSLDFPLTLSNPGSDLVFSTLFLQPLYHLDCSH